MRALRRNASRSTFPKKGCSHKWPERGLDNDRHIHCSLIGRNEMSFVARRVAAFSTAIILLAAGGSSALAQKKYDPGVTDTEIKIGNIMPYSGPASAYGVIGRTEAAYFRKINAEGGINGRKINFISYDDAYSPPKAVEQARKLVESDEVFLIFGPLGTPSNTAIQKIYECEEGAAAICIYRCDQM